MAVGQCAEGSLSEGQCPDCRYCSASLAHDGLRCGFTGYPIDRDESCDRFEWVDESTRLRKTRNRGRNDS